MFAQIATQEAFVVGLLLLILLLSEHASVCQV